MSRSRPTGGWTHLDGHSLCGCFSDLDDRLLVRAARCRISAFNSIVDRYYDSVLALIKRICGPAEAEDLAQETFLRAVSNFDTFEFRDDSSLRKWLHRIAANTAINALHLHNRRQNHEGWSLNEDRVTENGTLSRCIPDIATEPHRVAEREQMRRRLCDAIRSLSAKHREALVLIDLQELQYSEAAAIIGCQMGTLKSRLSRARESLAAKMRHHQNLLATGHNWEKTLLAHSSPRSQESVR